MKKKKETYVSPALSAETFEIENSIALSSSTATFKGAADYRPDIDNWMEKTATESVDI